jgi:hypothetical protein
MAGHLTEFSAPSLILCEGKGDTRLYERLLALHGLSAKFDITTPKDHGNGAFGRYLKLIHETSRTFREKVQNILIVSDNDDDPDVSFATIQQQLKDTKVFPVPEAAQQVAKAHGVQSVVILMLPVGKLGNIETICFEAAETKWQLGKHVESYLAQTPANGWGIGKQSKMKMQCVLAATCHDQPDITLAGHWGQKEDFHIPITEKCFDDVVKFLQNFEGLVA